MARGLHSLRQRTGNRNDSDGAVLPLTAMAPGGAGPDHNDGHRSRQLHTRRRRRMRSREWERRFKLRIVLANAAACVLFVCSVGLVLNRGSDRPALSRILPSFRSSHRGSSSLPKRGAPSLQRKRTEYDFVCKDDPNKRGVLNDDYCDCDDGSDEPNTSACSNILVGKRVFPCNQLKSINNNDLRGKRGGSRVFASRVKDGVVDCSNGSDER